mmetsp:Transcript_84560/g.215281  ORF Transcript_84560/g.215281 Transcript_84560/m.215281 type:complete len:224 (+) Transcript_84560:347-1018(+)
MASSRTPSFSACSQLSTSPCGIQLQRNSSGESSCTASWAPPWALGARNPCWARWIAKTLAHGWASSTTCWRLCPHGLHSSGGASVASMRPTTCGRSRSSSKTSGYTMLRWAFASWFAWAACSCCSGRTPTLGCRRRISCMSGSTRPSRRSASSSCTRLRWPRRDNERRHGEAPAKAPGEPIEPSAVCVCVCVCVCVVSLCPFRPTVPLTRHIFMKCLWRASAN